MTFPGAGNRGRPGVTALPLPHPQHCRRPGGPGRKLSGKAEAWVGLVQTRRSRIPALREGPAKRKCRPGRVGGMGFPGPTGLSRKLARALPIS